MTFDAWENVNEYRSRRRLPSGEVLSAVTWRKPDGTKAGLFLCSCSAMGHAASQAAAQLAADAHAETGHYRMAAETPFRGAR